MYGFKNQVTFNALFLVLCIAVFVNAYGILWFEIPLDEDGRLTLALALIGSVFGALIATLNLVFLYIFRGIELLVRKMFKKTEE